MLRTIVTATAVLCMSQPAFAQEMAAEQRSACMGDYEKYCKGVTPAADASPPASPRRATSSRRPARRC